MVDVEYGEIKFCLNHGEVSFNVDMSIKQPMDLQVVLLIVAINVEVMNYDNINLVDDPLVGVLWNYEKDEVNVFDEVVPFLTALESYTKNPIIHPQSLLFLSHLKLS